MPDHERADGPTPNGGKYSEIFYRDDNGDPADKKDATQAEIVEYGDHDQVIHRTYGTIGKGKTAGGAPG